MNSPLGSMSSVFDSIINSLLSYYLSLHFISISFIFVRLMFAHYNFQLGAMDPGNLISLMVFYFTIFIFYFNITSYFDFIPTFLLLLLFLQQFVLFLEMMKLCFLRVLDTGYFMFFECYIVFLTVFYYFYFQDSVGAAVERVVVELFLDNTDRKLSVCFCFHITRTLFFVSQIDKDEVSIRREVNAKESIYHVDNRHVQFVPLESFYYTLLHLENQTSLSFWKELESPYQASLTLCHRELFLFHSVSPFHALLLQVVDVATMTPEGRLKLCKDVSGATTYEDRDAQAEKILAGDGL